VQYYTRFSLGEIVNTQVLQEIQDKFSEATGLAAVIVDPDGKPITKPSNFTKFCTFIRSHPEGFVRCMACDDRGGRKAVELHRPFVYHCHSGLTDLAAPIIVQNEYLGAFLAGQVVLPQEDFDAKQEMFRRLAPYQMDFSTSLTSSSTILLSIILGHLRLVKTVLQFNGFCARHHMLGFFNMQYRRFGLELRPRHLIIAGRHRGW